MRQTIIIQEEEERRLIQREYRKLLRCVKNKTKEDEVNIRAAYEIAVEAHQKQRRKSGEPYILHPIEVARICAEEIGLGPTAVVSALLHDVVEDTDVTLDEIHKKFGDKITMIVGGLTKLDGMMEVESKQAENFKKVLKTLTKDVRVVLIKMADRMHNMRTLGAMKPSKQMKIASETAFIYAPLAHRLGLYNIKTEFQDLCMKIMDPENYHDIARKLAQTKAERERYINEFLKPLTPRLDEKIIKYEVTGRPKSISSIFNKIQTKKVPFEQIYDLFAVRIVVDVPKSDEKSTCWNVYSIITDYYTPIPERLKDWISTPKGNGYESLHTTVVGPNGRYVEVQIRSQRMNDIAERGFAAHWKYKGVNSQSVFDIWLNSIREVLESPTNNAVQFLNDFKANLFSDEVYVFTPMGDMKMFPKGATALDFAFSVHTEVGYHCMAVKVHQKLVPLNYELQNGDQLTVTTSRNQKPNESWLKMVVTGRAKTKIRQALKEERKKLAELGKEILMRKFKNMKADWSYKENIDFLVKYYGLKSHLNFFYEIYLDKTILSRLKDLYVENGKLIERIPQQDSDIELQQLPKTSLKSSGKPKLLINGEDATNYPYSLATCCNPVQGDAIFAFTTSGSGVKIHRKKCPNATHLAAQFGYRILKAEWVNTINTAFVVGLKIVGVDDIGVVQRLTHIITNILRVNMRSISMDGQAGFYEGRIYVVVYNRDQLRFVIETLKKEEGVTSVERIE